MPSPLTYANIVDGTTPAVAATWNSRFQPVYDQIDAHLTNATVGSQTAQNHLFSAILPVGALPLTTARAQTPADLNLAIDMLAKSVMDIAGTGAVGNFSTVTIPATLAALNTTLTGLTGGTATVPFAGGLKGPTAGRLLVGAGASAMTELAPGTTGNIVQSNGTTFVSAALNVAASIVPGSLAFSDLSGGYATANGTLTITFQADSIYDVNGKLVPIPQTTYVYGAGGNLAVPGAGLYRADLFEWTTTGALRATAGTAGTTEALALAGVPAITSTTGKPLAVAVLGPTTTAINQAGPSSAGVGYLRDGRAFGFPAAALVAATQATNTLLNSTSNASVTADTSGNITFNPTLSGKTTSGSDITLTGTASYRQQGYLVPQTVTSGFVVHTGSVTTAAASPYPPEENATYEGNRTATHRYFDNDTGWHDGVIAEYNVIQRGLPLALTPYVPVTVTAGGSGYALSTALPLTFTRAAGDTTGQGAVGVANTNGSGVVTSATISNVGWGYQKPPTVTITTPGAGTGATFTSALMPFARTGLHMKMYSFPDMGGESSGLLSIHTGGSNALTAYGATSFRPQYSDPDFAMAAQGAIEIGTDRASQAIGVGVNGPIGVNAKHTATTGAYALAITTALPIADYTQLVIPTAATPYPLSLNGPLTNPAKCYVRLTNPSYPTAVEIVGYTGVDTTGGANTLFSITRACAGSINLGALPVGGWPVGTVVTQVWEAVGVISSVGYANTSAFVANDASNLADHRQFAFVAGCRLLPGTDPDDGTGNFVYNAALRMDGALALKGAGQVARTPQTAWDATHPFGATLSLIATDTASNSGGAILFGANPTANQPSAAIKSAQSNSAGLGQSALIFSIRAATGDTSLTERFSISPTAVRLGNSFATNAEYWEVDANGHLRAAQVGTAVSGAAGAGAGTGGAPAVVMTGSTDQVGYVQVTCGSTMGTVGSRTIATVTFGTPFTTAPIRVLLVPDNAAAKALANNQEPIVASITTTGFILQENAAVLTASGTFVWDYFVL